MCVDGRSESVVVSGSDATARDSPVGLTTHDTDDDDNAVFDECGTADVTRSVACRVDTSPGRGLVGERRVTRSLACRERREGTRLQIVDL